MRYTVEAETGAETYSFGTLRFFAPGRLVDLSIQ